MNVCSSPDDGPSFPTAGQNASKIQESEFTYRLQDGCMTDVNSEQISNSEPDRDQIVDQFYREHSRELWALFYGMCSDPERAYDAVQESFLRFSRLQR